MATEFKPVMYLKLNCPFCLKVAAFLEEAGVFGDFDVREFWPGDEREAAIRGELSPHVATISFPTVQVAPGEFLSESDSIIERFGHGFDPNIMPFYRYILDGPVRRLREQFAEIKELNEKLARIGS
jgi:glutathione S-transferase